MRGRHAAAPRREAQHRFLPAQRPRQKRGAGLTKRRVRFSLRRLKPETRRHRGGLNHAQGKTKGCDENGIPPHGKPRRLSVAAGLRLYAFPHRRKREDRPPGGTRAAGAGDAERRQLSGHGLPPTGRANRFWAKRWRNTRGTRIFWRPSCPRGRWRRPPTSSACSTSSSRGCAPTT